MQLLSNKNLISSLELVEQINLFRQKDGKSELGHNDLLKVIRDEFEEEISLGIISQSDYKNDRGQTYPKFDLTISQAKQVLVRESKMVRKAVIAFLEKIESQLAKKCYAILLEFNIIKCDMSKFIEIAKKGIRVQI